MREIVEHWILVRHLPRPIRDDQIEDLFSKFGSMGIRILNARPERKTTTAFVRFRSLPEAECAITRLHGMEVMGFRLSAELSYRSLPVFEPPGHCDTIKDKETQYLSLLKQLDLHKCPPSGPKYIYPPPSLHVMLNILSALYEHKRFYTQVLHLMNKMNLECPFNVDYARASKINQLFVCQKLWTPELMHERVDDLDVEKLIKSQRSVERQKESLIPDEIPVEEASDTDEEMESEMEDSDREERKEESQSAAILSLKRVRERRSRGVIKRPRFIKPLPAVKVDNAARRTSDKVFETAVLSRKPIQVKVSSDLISISGQTEDVFENQNLTIIGRETISSQNRPGQTDLKSSITKTIDHSQKIVMGQEACQDPSGSQVSTEAESEQACRENRVISKEELDSNRLGERDRSFIKAFNNYSAGSPSCRLYVKNLAKGVTQADMEFIFRRYYLPDYTEQGTMFDIRLMQEGRMKGQAFITLQTEAQARQALRETNGYLLKDKPMVVQFARSIQAKTSLT